MSAAFDLGSGLVPAQRPPNGSGRVAETAALVKAAWYAESPCTRENNLCFLRWINGDRRVQGRVTIRARSASMLAKRTDENLDLFKEEAEAGFFESDLELLDKVRYYVDYAEQGKRIAATGRERCLRSGYGYHERIRWMLEKGVKSQ